MSHTIQVLNRQFSVFIREADIQEKVRSLARIVTRDYEGKNPLFIVILNGAFMFAADFFKQLRLPEAEISFIKLASYSGSKSSGSVITAIGLDERLLDRDIVLVDDILDTGATLYQFIHGDLQARKPRSIKTLVLLHKKEATQYDIVPDYAGFEIENKFMLGYGLDYDGRGRNLVDLYQEA